MSDPNAASVLAIIVNFRTAALTEQCLASLARERVDVPRLRTVVIDNASDDDSMPHLTQVVSAAHWGDWVDVLPLSINEGFAAGCNVGFQRGLDHPEPPDYFLVLNPDTRLQAGALIALMNYAAAHPNAGILGPCLEAVDGIPQHSAFRFPSVRGEFEATIRWGVITRLMANYVIAPPIPDQPSTVDWLAGACLLIRCEVIEQVGLMDATYFLYYEEVDYCLRARSHGWGCAYVPTSHVIHLVGQSTGIQIGAARTEPLPDYWFAARRRYWLKHLGWGRAALADLARIVGTALSQIRYLIRPNPHATPPHYLRDLIRHSVWLTGGRIA